MVAVAVSAALFAACGFRPLPAVPPAGIAPDPWQAGGIRAPFALRWNGRESRLKVVSTSVLPGESVRFEAVDRAGAPLASVVSGADGIERDGAHGWRFAPPGPPGLHVLDVQVPELGERIRLNVFTAVPRARLAGGRLNGYRIGAYPLPATVQGAAVAPPRGFIEVTETNAATPLTPRFTLGQFLCRQEGGFPKYVVLDDRLPLKLEALLDRVRAEGRAVSSLHVMSGYRTPAYNRALRNVDFSRHLWGAAADVFVDESPRDGVMDDLNADGRVDRGDAEWLAGLAESLELDAEGEALVGGVGRYGTTSAHGPFVHVDVRHRSARW